MKTLRFSLLLLMSGAALQTTHAQSTWTGASLDQTWTNSANWASGILPSGDAVTFPDGAFPVTTNVQGAVNNIVPSSTAITSLTYNNGVNDFVTTQINPGSVVTVNGNLTVGPGAIATVATITGGGTLKAGTGTSTFSVQSTTGTAFLDLSTLSNFVFNSGGAGGPINLGTGTGASGMLNLAGASNNITATTFDIGDNNTSGTSTVNLGNGTNIINADTFNVGFSKTTGNLQFLNNAGGGLKIANHTGTGRAAINVSGEAQTGSTGANNNGNFLFNGGTVNILASTLTMGNRVARGGGGTANGVLSFNAGTVDATTITLALNASGGSAGNGTISVGGTGKLIAGTGGISLANEAGTAGTGALIVTNGGTVICNNNIFKTTSGGTGIITISGGTLVLTNALNSATIGVANGFPVDDFNLTNATLLLPVESSANVVVVNLNPDADTTSTLNVGSLPSITAYPSQFAVISYQVGVNLDNIVLGTLPGTFVGYISNNIANSSIDVVITNGPSTAKADLWAGSANNQWDTTSLDWTTNGLPVKYNDGDFVTFDDTGKTNIVNLTATRKPATLEVNNSVLNYVFEGSGNLSGPVALNKDGSASLTLAETGGDNLSGGIMINAGTLVLDDASSAISGGLVIAGGATAQLGNNDANGSLPSGTLDDEGTLIFNRTDNITVGTVIPGGGSLIQSGSGRLVLSAANTYSGNTTVVNGTLALTNAGSIASSAGVVVTNATLDVSGTTGTATLTSLNLANASLTVQVGYLATNLSVASLNMGGSSNTINVRVLPPIANYPATVALLRSANPIVGYNFVLGSVPAGSLGTSIALSGDQTEVLLTVNSGPIGIRPSVTWSGLDALAMVSTNWSDATNWLTPGVPAPTEKVTFNNSAVSGGTPFDVLGDGAAGIVNTGNIDNIVDKSFTNASLTYANDTTGFHNTQIAAGKTLTVNGPLTVSGSGGTVSILGAGGSLKLNNPGEATTLSVEGATSPTLDMSGLDTFTANVTQLGVGFNPASVGARVSGALYLARTNIITTGVGFFSTGAALEVGGSTGSTGGVGQLYLGQSNAIFVDGIVLGTSTSTGDLIEFNPALTNNPTAYIRGITGNSSRVTVWSLGDDSININNGATGNGYVNDFSTGTLDAMVSTLLVGQGAHGNTVNSAVTGTFNMGAGNLDVTTLDIGVAGIGTGGTGIGIMNVAGGTLMVNSLGLGVSVAGAGGTATTAGTLNLTSNATLVVSGDITNDTLTAGGTLSISASTMKLLNGSMVGTPVAPLVTLYLDGATLQMSADANAAAADITAINVTTTANTNIINIAAIANVSGTAQILLLSYTGADPYSLLSLGTSPAGYNVALVDDVSNNSIDLSVTSTAKPTPTITSVSVNGTTLTLTATNGASNGPFVLLGTTNLTTPLHLWTPILTNSFDSGGSVNLSTNIINPATPQEFFILSQ